MIDDLRYAIRSLHRAPAYGLMMVLTLALGIGANTAIFNVAWQVLLRPLPFPAEDRLVVIWEAYGPERQTNAAAPASFLDWQREGRSFELVAAYNQYQSTLNLTGSGEPDELDVTYVTEDFFRVLGLQPVFGRPILPADRDSERRVLVLSEHLWRRTFGADPGVLGRVVRLHGEAFEVIGVMPDAAALASSATDAWVRLPLAGEQARMRQAHYLRVVARLRPGVPVEQADREARAISERAFEQFAAPGVAMSARVTPFRQELTGSVRPAVLVLIAGAALVLLIACANLSGLQLARQVGRRKDLAVHAALGASRARQIRQQLAEALVLALPAGYAGLLLGTWVLAGIGAAAPTLSGLGLTASPGPMVAAFTFALSIAASFGCALISTRTAATPSLHPLLSDRGAAGDGRGNRLRALLVTVEVALSVLVLVGAALLVTSLLRVLRVNPGFTFDTGLVVNVDLPEAAYPDTAARARFFDRAIDEVGGLAGVEGACAMTTAPLVERQNTMTWVAEGQSRMVGSLPTTISPACFEVLGMTHRRGRRFSAAEPEQSAIVSEALGRQLFGEADPVGQRIHRGLPGGPLFTIVGVVGNIRKLSLESSYANQIWLPMSGPMYPPTQLVVRTGMPPGPLANAVRATLRGIDPQLPVTRIDTMAGVRAHGLAARRFNMLLLLTYGAVGLTLCAVGVYGMLAQAVGQRTREIGVRMALGARPSDVVRQVVRGAVASVLAGVVTGLGFALALSRLVRHMLFEVSPADPAVYALVVAVVCVVALLAAYRPARRATRIDPLTSLRSL